MAIVVSGCGEWWSEPNPSNQIDRTRILGTRVEVVELGPAWPLRIGDDPDDPPITEAMPGDRVQVSGMMVDAHGRALPSADFDAIWLLCPGRCGVDLPRCEDLDEWTTDVDCELGRGGELEFELPALGMETLRYGGMAVIGIFALDPGIDAERCRALVREPGPDLDKCGVATGDLEIGPRWGLMAELQQAGVEIDYPLFEVPLAAFEQPANRLALPTMPIWMDVDRGTLIVGSPLRVRRGQHLVGYGPTWRDFDTQPFVVERAASPDIYVYLGQVERRDFDWYYSVGLTPIQRNETMVELEIDEDAEFGPVSAVMVFGDFREDFHSSAYDFRVVEFEVVP